MLFVTKAENFGLEGRAVAWTYVYGLAVQGYNVRGKIPFLVS